MTAWTHYWKKATAQGQAHGLLDHTAGNSFRSRGVGNGDRVYVISFWDGTLKVLGRLDVDRIVDQAEAERIQGEQLWDADDHVLAERGSASKLGVRVVPDSKLGKIEFINADGSMVSVKYNRRGKVEGMTFQVEVREITTTTARLFDQLLGC